MNSPYQEYQQGSHVRWDCTYYIVFCPKFRKRIIYGKYKKYLGFYSRECYEGARTDGYIKDVEWDKCDYKNIRLQEGSIARIQAHLDRKLANIEWKYQTSQKEDNIVEC